MAVQRDEGVTVRDIASYYGYTEARARQLLKERGLEDRRQKDPSIVIEEGGGRKPAKYRTDFITELFPDFDATRVGPSRLVRDLLEPLRFLHGRKLPAFVEAVLESRGADPAAFEALAQQIIARGTNLKIRSIAATFVSSKQRHEPMFKAFEQRYANKLSKPQLLLLHPFAAGARRRSNVEEGTSRPSVPVVGPLTADALKTYRQTSMWDDFERAWKFVTKDKAFDLEVKWVDATPHSFLIYCDELALLETYDLGRDTDAEDRVCVGRRAPVLVIKAGSYLRTLREGFDWVFKPDERSCVRTFTDKDVQPDKLRGDELPVISDRRAAPRARR